jgi:glucose-1-phosphate adenylyltransferase
LKIAETKEKGVLPVRRRRGKGGTKMDLKIMGLILAGGKGTRLSPLTKERAKPAVPFGGKYRIVDFVLSNFINSGIYSIYVLIQFRSQSLLQHLRDGWQFGGLLKEQFIIPVPAQMRTPGETWYKGTADAVYQNANLIEQSRPDLVILFGADHIYLMDIRQMIEAHRARKAGVSIAAIPVDRKFAKDFGVLEVDEEGRIKAFIEKDPDAPGMPGQPDKVLASMGNYIFERELLLDMVGRDAKDPASSHDFGKDILPRLIGQVEMFAYDFQTNRVPGDTSGRAPYWRDVGTLDAYYEASMDMRTIEPPLNLYNRSWPVRTATYSEPPAKTVFDDDGRRGQALDSMVSGGCIISGATVRRSILGPWVRVNSGALVEDCVLFDNVEIGRRAKVRGAIMEKNVRIPEDAVIGYDRESDAKQYQVTDSGLVVIGGRRSPVGLSSLNL